MRIWVTGIAGFLGSHLADALIADGHQVDGNDNLLCGDMFNSKVPFVKTDCCNYEGMLHSFNIFKPEVVVHCAATAHEGLSNFSPAFITRNIYEASVATFSAAIESGAKRIVYMSSMARYGHGSGYNKPPFTEDMTPAPIDPYGIAKVAAEETLKALCKVHGIKYAIAVPHNIVGIRQRSIDPYRNVAAIMINRCKQGKPPIIYGDGTQTRCFSPIKDCIPSIVKMVKGHADGEVVNIGPDNGEITVQKLAEMVRHLTGLCAEPTFMAARPNEVKEAYCSSDKARKLLGYQPKDTLENCLSEMVNYIKPAPFSYGFPIEIHSPNIPKTWSEELM